MRLTLILLLLTGNHIFAQSIIDVYQFNFLTSQGQNIVDGLLPIYNITNSQFHLIDPSNIMLRPGFSGEYEVEPFYKPFDYLNQSQGFTFKIKMELVSFPFVPRCGYDIQGCGGQIGREFQMPIDPYSATTESWGIYSNKFGPRDLVNSNDQSLSSTAFVFNSPMSIFNQTDIYLPHTVIKHTLYVYCSASTIPVYSFSWYYDNTRGRMRYYPFCNPNGTNCTETDYDVVFSPEIIMKSDQEIGEHFYNENNQKAVLDYNGLNYFPFENIPASTLCSGFIDPSDYYFKYDQSFSHSFTQSIFPAPYCVLNAPLLQWRTKLPAGFEQSVISTAMQYKSGIKHNYYIDKTIDLKLINPDEKIIFNPSEVTIDPNAGNNLGNADPISIDFPSNWTFKTILGSNPSYEEAIQANLDPQNGNYSEDLTKVLVPVNAEELVPTAPGTNLADYPKLSYDDPLTFDSNGFLLDERFGYYHVNRDASIIVQDCVNIYDARFNVNVGGALEFSNYPSVLGFEDVSSNFGRYKIRNNGGAVLRNYKPIQFIQNSNIIQNRILNYIAVNSIIAGSNVDPNLDQPSGDFITNVNSNVNLITGNEILLKAGVELKAGSNVLLKISADMALPSECRFSNRTNQIGRYSYFSADKNNNIVISPNPTNGILNIKLEGGIPAEIHLINAIGQVVKIFKNNSSLFQSCDISDIKEGVYFIQFEFSDKSFITKKIVKI